MIYLFILLVFPLNIISENDDIVQTSLVNLESYSKDKLSYCKERAKKENLIWSEEFNENSLSSNTWHYSTTNGFYDGRKYISGWGNGELQYYTQPSHDNKNLNISKNLLIERW